MVKCLITAIIAAFIYYLGNRRKNKKPERIYSNEAILFFGVLATATSITFLGRAIDTSGHFNLMLILLGSIIYGILGLWFPSKLVWVFSILSIGIWMGTETGYMSGWGAYYLGMNYPLRFFLFGIALTATSGVFNRWQFRKEFLRPTRAIGLLNLFIALWIMSIFGNYGDMQEWEKVKQIELFHWSIIFGLAAIFSIYHGIKEDDSMTRGFGITFLFINLYTRFFEYFWDNIHKAIFFAILAVSFWYLGSRAEKIWNVGGLSGNNKSGKK
jgi:MFS family permease